MSLVAYKSNSSDGQQKINIIPTSPTLRQKTVKAKSFLNMVLYDYYIGLQNQTD